MSVWLNERGRLRAGFQILVFYSSSLAVTFFIQEMVGTLGIADALAHQAVLYPLEAASLYALSVLAFALFQGSTAKPLGLGRKSSWWIFGCSAMAGLVAMALIFLAMWFPIRDQSSFLIDSRVLTSKPFYLGLIAFFFAAAFEELGFRGFPFLVLRQPLGRWWATVLLSVLFVAAHPGFYHSRPAWAAIFLGGVFFTQLFVLTGNLWSSIGFHFFWNFSQYVLFPLPGRTESLIQAAHFEPGKQGIFTGVEESWWASGLLLIMVVIAEWWIRKRARHQPMREEDP